MTALNLKEKAKAVFKLGIGDWLAIIGMIVGAAVYNERRFATIEMDNQIQNERIQANASELGNMKQVGPALSRIDQSLTDIVRRLERIEDRKP